MQFASGPLCDLRFKLQLNAEVSLRGLWSLARSLQFHSLSLLVRSAALSITFPCKSAIHQVLL
jgi:hypothetical protein